MHPVTRVGRIIQQLRSFGELHASELETMAEALDAAGAGEVAAQLRAYRVVQRDEADVVLAELVDIQSEMAQAGETQPATLTPRPLPEVEGAPRDPAVNSPKRAKWLAEQAAEAERLRQPVSRRELFGRVAPKSEDDA